MKRILPFIVILFCVSSFRIYATELPKLSLQLGKTYIIKTVNLGDTSKSTNSLKYERCIYSITPQSFDQKKQTYILKVVLSKYKYAFQKFDTTKGFFEENAYETGFESPFQNPYTHLNRNKINIYITISTFGKIIKYDFSEYEKHESINGFKVQFYSMEKNDFKRQLQSLFFIIPLKTSNTSWERENIIYELVEKNNSCIKLKAEYLSHRETRKDFINEYWLDLKTGLIREKKYSYLFSYGYPGQKADKNKYFYQRFIPVFFEKNKIKTMYMWHESDTKIQKANTVICGHIKHLPKDLSYLQIQCGNTAYKLLAKNNFRFETKLINSTDFNIYAIRKNKWFDKKLSFRFKISPGDSLYLQIHSFEKDSIGQISGIGAFEAKYSYNQKKYLKNRIITHYQHINEELIDSINKSKSFMNPDFYLDNLYSIIYNPYQFNFKKNKSTKNLLINNTIAVENPIYISFLRKHILTVLIPEIKKSANMRLSVGKSHTKNNYYMARLAFNDIVCGYYTQAITFHSILFDRWRFANDLYAIFSNDYKNMPENEMLKTTFIREKKVAPESKAPNLIMTDINGNTVKLKDFIGNAVMLRFWRYTLTENFNLYKKDKQKDKLLSEYPNLINIHVIMGTNDQLIEFKTLYKSMKNEIILFQNIKGDSLNKNIEWFHTPRSSFLIDKYGIIQNASWRGVPGVAVMEKVLEEKYNPITLPTFNIKHITYITGILLVLAIIFFTAYRISTKRKLKKEKLNSFVHELELRAIRSQMNPHFMFNSLNSIQNLVNKNKIEETNIYLSEFAELMRLVLNNSEKQLVPLEDELQLIKSYLDLEKLRIPFQFEIIIDPSINISEEEIPGMLIQPFVENAVIHGIAPQKGGFIKVSFAKNSSKIICEITDDGIGISKRREQRNGNGKAIKMVKERLKIVNSRTKELLTLKIIDRKEMNEKGTLVRIEIPV